MEEDKIKAIRHYLKNQFPTAKHADEDDFDRRGHKFRIIIENHLMLASILMEVIDDNNSEEIISMLDDINISNLLKSNPTSIIVVGRSGVSIESRK